MKKITKKQDIPALSLLAFFFCLFIFLSWQRYFNPFSESGRDLYAALQILDGKKLYTDIYWFYGPFAPYLHAILYKIFGVNLNVIYICGLANVGMSLFLFYLLGREFLPPLGSFVLAFLFLSIFAMPSQIAYVVPYNFSTVYANTFYIAYLFFLIRYYKRGGLIWLILGGSVFGFLTITKLEFAFASILTILIIAALKFFADLRNGKIDYKLYAYRLAAFLLPASLIFVVFFVLPFSFLEALHSIIRESNLAYAVDSSRGPQGISVILNYIAANIVKEIAVVGIIIAGVFCYKKFGLDKKINRYFKTLLFLGVIIFVSYHFYLEIIGQKKTLIEKYHWGWMVTTIPFLFGALAVLLSRWFVSFKKKEDLPRQWWGYLIILISCITLNLRYIGTGLINYSPFFYTAPVIILWVIFFLRILPEKIEVLRKNISLSLEKVFIFIFIAYGFYLFALSGWNFRKEYVYKLNYPRGTIITDVYTGPLFDSVVSQVKKDLNPDEKFFSMMIPASGLIYFLSEREGGLRYQYLHYSTCSLIEDDLQYFRSRKINYILLDDLMSSHFDMLDFALCDKFMLWVRQNYSLEKSFRAFDPKRHFFEHYNFSWYKIK